MTHFVDVGVCLLEVIDGVIAGVTIVEEALFIGVEFVARGEGFGFVGLGDWGLGGLATRVGVRVFWGCVVFCHFVLYLCCFLQYSCMLTCSCIYTKGLNVRLLTYGFVSMSLVPRVFYVEVVV